MKKLLLILLLVLIAGGIFFAIKMRQQQERIDAVPNAEVGGNTQESQNTGDLDETAASTIVVTSTPAEKTQSGNETLKVNFDESFLTFEGYAPGKSHVGTFETFEATIDFDQIKTITGGKIMIEAASVKTDSSGVDEHLRSEDFFGVEEFPTIEYVLDDVVVNAATGEASATGVLTLHGVTKPITSPVTVLPNGFETKFNLSMKEFGIEHMAANDEVTIEAKIVLQ